MTRITIAGIQINFAGDQLIITHHDQKKPPPNKTVGEQLKTEAQGSSMEKN